MDHLDRLAEISDHVLSGLKSDENLKHRILLSAASQPQKRKISFRTLVALCSLSVLLILICVLTLHSKPAGDLQVMSAGSRHSSPPIRLETMLEEASELESP